MNKKILQIIIGFLIIAGSLFYAFKDVSVSEIIISLGSINYIYIFPAVFLFAMTYLFRAMRWRHLIASVKEVETVRLISPLMVGFMGNMLPARAGEFIRAYLLGKKEQISFSASFATIFIERLFDLLFVLIMLSWVLLFKADVLVNGDSADSHKLMGFMIKFGFVSFFGCLFIFIFSVLLQYKNNWTMKLVNICIKPLPQKYGERIHNFVNSFTKGLAIIRDRRRLLSVMLHSLLISILIILSLYLLYLSFDIHSLLPVISSLIILVLTIDIFIAVFPTPGFFGSFHAACVAALHGIFGIPKAVALSYGIVAWLVFMGFTVVVGAIFAIKDNISIGELSSGREKIK
jgi:uncharacterized protein (TIRG00374 family)